MEIPTLAEAIEKINAVDKASYDAKVKAIVEAIETKWDGIGFVDCSLPVVSPRVKARLEAAFLSKGWKLSFLQDMQGYTARVKKSQAPLSNQRD